MSTRKVPTNPLIVICGATGTGKSALAISLAEKYNGEIINADAVQMYKGLPIVTNKVPHCEQRNIPHHLLDFIDLSAKTWTAHDFVREARTLIAEIKGRGKLPIVVGGTGYYVHSLLFETALLQDNKGDIEREAKSVEDEDVASAETSVEPEDLEALRGTTEELYARLMEVDPEMAKRWHPKDRRKIQRSLEIFIKTGKKASETYQEQRALLPADTPSMRYDALIFWLDAEDAMLKQRLDKRVESMIEKGLLEEVQHIRELDIDMTKAGHSLDKTCGIWVSLGYKELEPWLNVKDDTTVTYSVREKVLREGIEAVKAGTRRYAKRQNRYLRHRLARPIEAANASDKLFLLDTSEMDKWHDNVEGPAQQTIERFMAGHSLPQPAALSSLAEKTFERMNSAEDATQGRFVRYCEGCDKNLMTEGEWVAHIKSRSHKKVYQSLKRKAAQEIEIAATQEKLNDAG